MQTGGSFVTRKFRLLRNSNILIVSYPPKRVFAAGHRTIYRSDLRSKDVAYRRFLRSVVEPPRNMDGALPWHKIFHIWNEGVRAFTSQTGSKSRSEICRASLDQEGFSLATTGAHTQWPPKMLLGYFDYKFVPLEQLTFIGNFAIDVEFWRSNLPECF